MQVELLGTGCYVASLGPPPDGQDGNSHFALVRFADGIERRAFVKLYREQLKIINEATGHILAAAAGHDVPDRAAVVYVPKERLPQPIPEWLQDDDASEWPAWCSTLVPHESLKIFYGIESGDADLTPIQKELAESPQTAGIVAFDDWLANPDRNIGNLLRLSHGHYSLIDHGLIINAEAWTETKPDAEAHYQNKIWNLLGQEGEKLPFKNSAYEAASDHGNALRSAEDALHRWWSILDDEARRYLESFLTQRADNSDSLKQRLGLLT